MNMTLRHGQKYWGTKTDFASLLEHVRKIGPILEENAEENDKLGRLNEATFAALKPLRMSHIFAGEEIGGAQLSPTQALELLGAITYHSGSAGWISMVHACIGAMSAAFLPDSAIARLYAPGTENRFSGQGTPTGMLKKVDGGYLLNGKWSYASGIYHATFTHSACSSRRWNRTAGQRRERRRDRALRAWPGREVRPAWAIGMSWASTRQAASTMAQRTCSFPTTWCSPS